MLNLLIIFLNNPVLCVISDFRLQVDETCALFGHYTAYSDNSLLTFRDNLTVRS